MNQNLKVNKMNTKLNLLSSAHYDVLNVTWTTIITKHMIIEYKDTTDEPAA